MRKSLTFALLGLSLSNFGYCNNEQLDNALHVVLRPVSIATNAISDAKVNWDTSSAREVFDVKLPGELSTKYVFSFEPRLGDVVHRDFIRFPLKLEYAFLPAWTYTLGLTPISANPIRSPHIWGLGFLTNEFRYDWKPQHMYFESFAFGAGLDTPLGHVPVSLINGFNHLRTYATASKVLTEKSKILLQLTSDSCMQWVHKPDASSDKVNVLYFGPAYFYKPKEFGYLCSLSYKCYDGKFYSYSGYLSRVGVQWDIPKKRSAAWGLPGKWELETALQVETRENNHTDTSLSTRVKWKFGAD